MGLFRIQHTDFEQKFKIENFDTVHMNEWDDTSRINEQSWQSRYDYESDIAKSIIESYKVKSVLELGSGPGILSQKIQSKVSGLSYTLLDKPFAKKYFDDNNFVGKFIVKDMSIKLDHDGLEEKYDMIMANDFLEHVFSPSLILQSMNKLTHENSVLFISNPNWRMSHQFIYRGLFDFDNFLYMFYTHGFESEGIFGSPLKTPNYPRTSSETLLPDENLTDWNHYFVFKKRKDY